MVFRTAVSVIHALLLAGVGAVSLVGCATPELINNTPGTTSRSPVGLYPIRAQVNPKGSRVTYVHAIINGTPWPMMPIGTNDYAVGYFASACETTIPYRYSVGYQRRNILGSGYSSSVDTKSFPEAGGFLLTLEGELPPDCLSAVGHSFTVNSTADVVDTLPGDGFCRTEGGECTLRAAIMESNTSPGHDFVRVPAGHYQLALTGVEVTDTPNAAVGDLDIIGGLTLVGASFARENNDLGTIINGGAIDRIFDIYTPMTQFVNLAYLRLENGRPVNSGGGAIWNRGNLRMDRLALLNNTIEYDTGHSCGASVSMRICNRGAGLLNEGEALLYRSTVAGNSTGDTSGRGGGLSNLGARARLLIRQSLVNDNDARFNGGLANYAGEVEISNSTFANNRSTTSGVVAAEIGNYDGTVNARNATFRNTSMLFGHNGAGAITIANSLVNIDTYTDIPFCSGAIDSAGFNIIGGPSDLTDHLSGCGYSPNRLDRTDVRLSLPDLDYNGGPTRTIELVPRDEGSAFFDPINFGGVLCPEADQRGSARDDGNCDTGAFER